MLRENLTPGSRSVFIGVLGSKRVALTRRTTVNGTTSQGTWVSATAPWLRMVRTGNAVETARSLDGTNWTICGTVTMDLPSTVVIGPCVASGASGATMSAVVSQWSLTTPTAISPSSIAINFQTGAGIVVAGGQSWLPADGAAFAPRQAGVSYGFATATTLTYNRNSTLSLDERYDTGVAAAITNPFELAVPNGVYAVTVTVGDANTTAGKLRPEVEGVRAVTGVVSNSTRWFSGTVQVTVNDGRLTLRCGTGATAARWGWLLVTPVVSGSN